jgi:hypothetical protein
MKKRQRSVSGDLGPTWFNMFSLLMLHLSSPFLFVLSFLKTENWPRVAETISYCRRRSLRFFRDMPKRAMFLTWKNPTSIFWIQARAWIEGDILLQIK